MPFYTPFYPYKVLNKYYICNMKNISHLAKDLSCEYNHVYSLIKKYKIKFTYNQITKDIHIDDKIYDKLVAYQSKMKDDLLSIEQLSSIKLPVIPIDQQYYIYFLFNNDDLVYIGQTCSLVARIGSHQNYTGKQKKSFNYISTIQVPSSKILMIEAFYIDKYKPKHNIVHINSSFLVNYVFENTKF
jgi:hypothetical protein